MDNFPIGSKAVKKLKTLLPLLVAIMCSQAYAADMQNLYDFSFNDLVSGEKIDLSQYKNQVVMIVNTASNCGFTKQYSALEALYNKYKNKGFVVVGVPSNDFAGQEPGSHGEIADFCQRNYGVTFPMTQKEVVSGNDPHPFFAWAYTQFGFGSAPKWNFHKLLFGKDGKAITYYFSFTAPDASQVISAVEEALAN